MFQDYPAAMCYSFKICLLFVGLLLSAGAAPKKNNWTALRHCKWVDGHIANDGDSFYVTHAKRNYKFRLCYVDAPEADGSAPWVAARQKDQADYFGIKLERLDHYAKMAAERSKIFFKSGRPIVYTRWKDARGQGKPRHYCMVKVDDLFLCEVLVSEGLVRISPQTGAHEILPSGSGSKKRFLKHLYALEAEAKESFKGCWAERETEKNDSLR